ncbi:hypothetical protein [Halomonas organivorans]|uniref:Uncharacterized protein n=1 Tax=Halomonas organivorans TaxID=257772 RepID=A0A7W5C2X4_9GAMM|nr:hypothetical protein [Halomonas organivorans]MBB3142783.1 hypothetical protein [Halomonas organivorans]
MPLPPKPNIESLSVWLDKPAVQQAFTTLVAPIIEAAATAQAYGEEVAGQLHGDDGRLYPKAGEAVIGRPGSLVVKLVVEPAASGGWVGESLTHDEINAIGISDMVVDGKRLTPRKEA